MTTATLKLDSREFSQALRDYKLATKKSCKDVANRAMKTIAYHGVIQTRQAERTAIERLEDKAWWPKYVATILGKRRLAAASARSAKRTKVHTKASLRSVARSLHYTREQARKASAGIIRRRLGSIMFLKLFFVAMGRAAATAYKGGGKTASVGRSPKGFVVQHKPATDGDLNAAIAVSYSKKRAGDVSKPERLLQEGLDKAVADAAADMRQYAAQRMRDDAQRHSARR